MIKGKHFAILLNCKLSQEAGIISFITFNESGTSSLWLTLAQAII